MYSAALAWLLMLCYQFSINLLHNRRARAPVLILSDSVASAPSKPRGLMQWLQWARQRFAQHQTTERWQQKDKKKKKNSLPVSFIPFKDKKIGKLKGCICSVTVEKDLKNCKQGDKFSPLRACVVSPAKRREIVRVEGRNSCIFTIWRRARRRGPVQLKCGYLPRKQRTRWHKQGLICAGCSQNPTSFSSFQAPRSFTSNNHIYKNPQTADLRYRPFALLAYTRPTDFISALCSLLRVVLDLNTSAHIGKQQLQQLGWLPLKDRAIEPQLSVVLNIYNNRAREYLKEH